MSISQFAAEHNQEVAQGAARLVGSVAPLVNAATSATVSTLYQRLEVEDGLVVQSTRSLAAMRLLSEDFRANLTSLGYYDELTAYAAGLPDQLKEFDEALSIMAQDVPGLPSSVQLTQDDLNLLEAQIEVSMRLLEFPVNSVISDFSGKIAMTLGSCRVVDLISFISDVASKAANIEQLAGDVTMLYFRVVADLVYARIEKEHELLFRYVGASYGAVRQFCRDLSIGSARGDVYTRSEIMRLDNGQTSSVMDACGGYGCRHWWAVAEVR